MKFFILCLFTLIFGYIVYGKFVEKVFGASSLCRTPAVRCADGVDFVQLPVWRIFLIQFLNIAGLGPVFGAVLGAVYGPVALLWIVFGSIFAGAVHDYLTGMFSLRYNGKTIVFMSEKLFGKNFKSIFVVFLIIILVLVGAVFAVNPAKMLADMTHFPLIFWTVAIFLYYFLTTLLPIDKLIGRFYPFFALILLISTVWLLCLLFASNTDWFVIRSFENLHPKGLPVFPLMFVTIACGAVSGFHATQSPIAARCISDEKYGRPIFYGAMITEGVIALIWATLGIAVYHNSSDLLSAVSTIGQGGVVSHIAQTLMGSFGAKLTVLSVVILSVTSGDTAFRSARLTLAEALKIPQKKISVRLIMSTIILGAGIVFACVDITALWVYFAWANQTLAMISLWLVSAYLKRKGRFFYVSLLPAVFMSMVCFTYILYSEIGLKLSPALSKIIALFCTFVCLCLFFLRENHTKSNLKNPQKQEVSAD